MKNQKSRRLNRKQIKRKTIKRKTIKRKQNKKLAYNQKKLYGGDFNDKEQKILKRLLKKKFNFINNELEDVMTKLNLISQVYSYPRHFTRLQGIIRESNSKKELNDWLQYEYDNRKGATDEEDSDYSDEEDDDW